MHLRIYSGVVLGTAALLLSSSALTGCGGSSGSKTTTSTYSAQIAWPARARDLTAPSSALSAKLEVENAGPSGASVTWVANRGSDASAHTQTYASATAGPTGSHRVVVTFYASADAAGPAVGTAAFTETIPATGVITTSMTVDSAVKTVEVVPDQTLTAPSTGTIDAVAKDAEGHVVALSEGSFFFEVTAGGDFLKIEEGRARAVTQGDATVTARVDGVTSAPMTVKVVASASFRQMGTLRGGGDGRPTLNGISGDGLTIVGTAFINSGSDYGNKPYRWTAAGGFEELQIGLTNPNTGSALRVSRDGTKIVGYTPGDITVGWIWNNGAVTWIRPLLTSSYTVATDASDNGKVVTGIVSVFGKNRGLRWRKNDSYDILFDGEDVATSSANAISADGTVVVGNRTLTSSPDVSHVMVQHGDDPAMEIPLPASVTSMHAYSCSSDGSVIVGSADIAGGASRPFRWTQVTGTVVFDQGTLAATCNSNGSIVIGNDGLHTFVWTQADGYQSLEAYTLKTFGLTVPGQPKLGMLVSDNGQTLAGAVGPSEEVYEKPWIVTKN